MVQNLTQGWAPPPPDQGLGGDDRYDIYLMHSAFYGYTEAAGGKVGDNPMTPDVIEEDAYFSFIVLENDYNGFANTPLNNLRCDCRPRIQSRLTIWLYGRADLLAYGSDGDLDRRWSVS